MIENRIDIYPFHGRRVNVFDSHQDFLAGKELARYIEEKWNPKEEAGWKSSYIPIVARILYNLDSVIISAGTMTYAQTHGCLEAIKEGKSFAPEVVNNLSIGVIPVTKDGYLILSRRNPALDHAGGVWNFAGGYMTSMLLDMERCDSPEYARDARLFDIHEQVRRRLHKEFYGLEDKDVVPRKYPNSLAWGFMHSLEMEIGWVVNLGKNKKEMAEHIRHYEVSRGMREHSEVIFVPIEAVEELISNQGDLLNEDPRTYASSDPRKLILLDDNQGELIGGGFKELIGQELDNSIIEELRKTGININIYSDSGDSFYTFNTHF